MIKSVTLISILPLVLKVTKKWKVDHDLQKIDFQTNYWKHSMHLKLKKRNISFFCDFFSPWYFFCFTLAQAHFFLTKLDCYTNKNKNFVSIIKMGVAFFNTKAPWFTPSLVPFSCWGPNLDVNCSGHDGVSLKANWDWKFWNFFPKNVSRRRRQRAAQPWRKFGPIQQNWEKL